MSSKRVILLTKDRCLSSKSNQFYGINASKGLNNNNNEQFNSIRLNKNNKFENVKFEQSKSTPFLKKSQNNNGLFDYKNDSKNTLNDWKKNDTPNFHESLKTQEMKNKYKWETKVKKGCNKSALSLHIEAYENLNETKNVTFASKTDFFKQQNKELMNPEIMQFKTSQKLSNFAKNLNILNTNMISRMIGFRSILTNVAKYSSAAKPQSSKRLTSEQFLSEFERVEGKEEEKESFIVPKEKLESLFTEHDKLLNEVDDLNDKYRRALAETENVRRRGQKQVEDAKVFAVQSFCKDLLEVADTLDLAIGAVKPENIEKNAEVKSLHDGVVMMKTVLLKTFEKHGLVALSPEGEKFDPNLHEAVFQIPKDQASSKPGHIEHVMKIGYSLHGRPVRAAQVGVVQN